jgi:hypothetical protein
MKTIDMQVDRGFASLFLSFAYKGFAHVGAPTTEVAMEYEANRHASGIASQ